MICKFVSNMNLFEDLLLDKKCRYYLLYSYLPMLCWKITGFGLYENAFQIKYLTLDRQISQR